MTISDAGENLGLDGLLVAPNYVALHTGDPGETGANEATGGSYVRQLVAFGAAAGGLRSNTAQVDFAAMPEIVAPGVMAWSVWSAVSGGVCRFVGWLSTVAKLVVVTAADLTANTFQSPAHGLVNDDRVVFEQIEDIPLPTGITVGTLYFVLAVTTDTFTISTTQDGAAVDLTAEGSALVRLVVPRTTTAGQTIRFAAGDLKAHLD